MNNYLYVIHHWNMFNNYLHVISNQKIYTIKKINVVVFSHSLGSGGLSREEQNIR